MKLLQPFSGEEHKSFYWPQRERAALLIHGFPGTPAEMRPLARSLHQTGWTVRGLLLPGFGPDIETLPERHPSEWLTAVQDALVDLQRSHHPVLLVGYSMGAALALQVATAQSPAGLILIAPFRQLGTKWQRLIGFLLKPFIRAVSPFKKVDFSDPQVRQNIANFLGGLDLDDPETQQTLREIRVPTRIFGELNQLGQVAYRLADKITTSCLVVQGTKDEVVHPQHTRSLLQRLPGPVNYAEVVAGHQLLDPSQEAWPWVEQSVLSFAQMIIGIT